jgi:VIT1/CCC1 family predicted Fe2+/Mn2+ transporter
LLRGDPFLTIRASNLVSFLVLFVCGYAWGRHTRTPSWKTGLLVMLVGAVLALIAIPLGG